MRDTQRSKLYRAERIAFCSREDRLESIEQIEQFTKKILNSNWTKRKYNGATNEIRVNDGRGRRSACSRLNEICIPVWARTKMIIIHEIAHTINTRKFRALNDEVLRSDSFIPHAAHGWEFANIYLEITKHFMGYEKFLALKTAFKKNRVKFRPKRKCKPNPKAIEALRKYREEKNENKI